MDNNIISAPSYMSLFISVRNEKIELATATGFVVESKTGPLLITNRHNVTGKNNETEILLSKTGAIPSYLVISHNKKNQKGQWVQLNEPLYNKDNMPRWIEHPRLKGQADVVALPLANLEGADIYSYNLDQFRNYESAPPASIISVVGFPYGLHTGGGYAIWVTGTIASEPSVDNPSFLIDCRTRKGQSGSPVIIYHPRCWVKSKKTDKPERLIEFIGVYSGRKRDDSDIGIVWKISILKELINSISYKNDYRQIGS